MTEETLSRNISQLKKKYGLKTRDKYRDAPQVQVFAAMTPKGQPKFELDIDTDWEGNKSYTVRALRKTKVCKTVPEVDRFLSTQKLNQIQDRVLSDKEIINYLSRQLSVRLKLEDVKNFTYVKWKNSIEVKDVDFTRVQLPYNQFKFGYNHYDDDIALAPIMMDLADFEAWLIKHGARQVPKPKRIYDRPLYD